MDTEDCAKFYRGANYVLNIHRDSVWSHFGHLNRDAIEATHFIPRFWEAAACSTMVLTNTRADLKRLFAFLPTFSGEDSLIRVIAKLDANTTR